MVGSAATSYDLYRRVQHEAGVASDLTTQLDQLQSAVPELPKGSVLLSDLSPELQQMVEGLQGVSQSPLSMSFSSWSDNGCTQGQFPQYDGSKWICASLTTVASIQNSTTTVVNQSNSETPLVLGSLTSATSGVWFEGGTDVLVGDNTSLHIDTASASGAGLLSASDWQAFNGKQSTLTFGSGLTKNGSQVTNNLTTGVSGGQTVYGGTDDEDSLVLSSTTSDNKGKIYFGNSVYDEANNRLGIGLDDPTGIFQVAGAVGDGGGGYIAIQPDPAVADINPGSSVWQSFVPFYSGHTNEIQFIAKSSRTDEANETITATLYQGEGTGGTVIGTGTGTLSGSDFDLQIIDFNSMVSLNADTTYTWKLSGVAGDVPWILYQTGNPMSDGVSSIDDDIDVSFALVDAGSGAIFTVQESAVGIGLDNPTALLNIAPGGPSEGTAALKFSSGYLLDTPESGAVEWDGTSLYITQEDGTRKTVAYTSDISDGSGGGGISGPLSNLVLEAGGTGSGEAALTFTSGDLLTTPAAGAVEWNGTNLYITQDDGTRQTVAFASDIPVDSGGTTYTVGDGLSLDETNITNTLAVGSGSGQTVIGGTDPAGTLTLSTTSDSTKGKIIFGSSVYDEAHNRLGIQNDSPTGLLEVGGGSATQDASNESGFAQTGASSVWQSFTAVHSGALTELSLFLSYVDFNGSPSVSGTLNIYEGRGTGGALLGTQSINLNDTQYFADWEDYVLDSPIQVQANTEYTYQVVPSAVDGSRPWIYIASDNPYSGGVSEFSDSWDLKFRMYVAPISLFTVTNTGTGIGVVSPSAGLELAAGSNAAGGAFLKFNAGALLDTPEAGAVEWDGTSLYVTQSDGTRKTVAYKGDALVTPVRWVTADTTLSATDTTLFVDSSSTSLTITLPDASTVTGIHYLIKRVDSGNHMDIDLALNGAQTIDGDNFYSLAPGQYSLIEIVSDGSNWQIVNVRELGG